MAEPQIAFDLTPLQNSHRHRGIGTYVRGLSRRLAAQSDVPIEFWAWQDLPMTIAPPHTLRMSRRIPMPRYRATWLFARTAMRLRNRSTLVKAVHVTDPDALTLLRGRKLLATVYDLIPLQNGVTRLRPLARAGYASYLRVLPRTNLLFAISEQTAGDLVELLHIPAERVRVARPGVDPRPDVKPQPKERRPYFLYLGGPNPNKNLGVLLAAMQRCEDLDEELRVAGQWLPKQIAALEGELDERGLRGRVRHLGFVPDDTLGNLMHEATALVVPSLSEGFGLPVAEGLAAGALVVHSRLPVLEETSQGTAITFDATSASDLADALHRAARDGALARRLRALGAERSRELTWDAALATTLAAYDAVLAT